MLKSSSWKNKIVTKNVKSEKMVGFVKAFDHYCQIFNFGRFFSSPKKLLKDFNLKFRPKFNHDFASHGYIVLF